LSGTDVVKLLRKQRPGRPQAGGDEHSGDHPGTQRRHDT
jgi:hypothetical protein